MTCVVGIGTKKYSTHIHYIFSYEKTNTQQKTIKELFPLKHLNSHDNILNLPLRNSPLPIHSMIVKTKSYVQTFYALYIQALEGYVSRIVLELNHNISELYDHL